LLGGGRTARPWHCPPTSSASRCCSSSRCPSAPGRITLLASSARRSTQVHVLALLPVSCLFQKPDLLRKLLVILIYLCGIDGGFVCRLGHFCKISEHFSFNELGLSIWKYSPSFLSVLWSSGYFPRTLVLRLLHISFLSFVLF
jgi:hypothetical protein